MQHGGLAGVQVVHAERHLAAHAQHVLGRGQGLAALVQEVVQRAGAQLKDYRHRRRLERCAEEAHDVLVPKLAQQRHLLVQDLVVPRRRAVHRLHRHLLSPPAPRPHLAVRTAAQPRLHDHVIDVNLPLEAATPRRGAPAGGGRHGGGVARGGGGALVVALGGRGEAKAREGEEQAAGSCRRRNRRRRAGGRGGGL